MDKEKSLQVTNCQGHLGLTLNTAKEALTTYAHATWKAGHTTESSTCIALSLRRRRGKALEMQVSFECRSRQFFVSVVSNLLACQTYSVGIPESRDHANLTLILSRRLARACRIRRLHNQFLGTTFSSCPVSFIAFASYIFSLIPWPPHA